MAYDRHRRADGSIPLCGHEYEGAMDNSQVRKTLERIAGTAGAEAKQRGSRLLVLENRIGGLDM